MFFFSLPSCFLLTHTPLKPTISSVSVQHHLVFRQSFFFRSVILFSDRHLVFRPPSCFRSAILFTDHHLIFSPPYCFLTTILFLNVILFFISILFSSDAILFYHDNYFVCKGKHLNLFTFILNLIKSL